MGDTLYDIAYSLCELGEGRDMTPTQPDQNSILRQALDLPNEQKARLLDEILQSELSSSAVNYRTSPEWNIFPSLGVDRLREMVKAGKKVVVAGGRYKLPALKAAVRGRLFNVLITDEMAAKELLNF